MAVLLGYGLGPLLPLLPLGQVPVARTLLGLGLALAFFVVGALIVPRLAPSASDAGSAHASRSRRRSM
jgi:hypothetical protein